MILVHVGGSDAAETMADTMWFIADILERYTTSVAKSLLRFAAREAEANRQALEAFRARRTKPDLILPERSLIVPSSLVAERNTLVLPDCASPETIATSSPRDPDSRVSAVLATLPMGIRGEVVAKYIEAFASADRSEAAALLERLRKDKKVRVPELQVIAADVLEEAPTFRKKDEHLALLGRHFGATIMRPQPRRTAGPLPQHA